MAAGADKFNAVAKGKAKKKNQKPSDTDDNGPAETAQAGKETVKESGGITAAELEEKLAAERAKTVADLRETLLKEHGLPDRKGYRRVAESEDEPLTGDDLWNKRSEIFAAIAPSVFGASAAASVSTGD
jgi:hypothetical protein